MWAFFIIQLSHSERPAECESEIKISLVWSLHSITAVPESSWWMLINPPWKKSWTCTTPTHNHTHMHMHDRAHSDTHSNYKHIPTRPDYRLLLPQINCIPKGGLSILPPGPEGWDMVFRGMVFRGLCVCSARVIRVICFPIFHRFNWWAFRIKTNHDITRIHYP